MLLLFNSRNKDSNPSLVYEGIMASSFGAERENVSMQFVPTTYQKADILTKGLQAYSHELAREGLRLRLCNGL